MTTPNQGVPPSIETLLGLGAFQIGGGSYNFGQAITETITRSIIQGAAGALGAGFSSLEEFIAQLGTWLATLPLEALQTMRQFIPGALLEDFEDVATAVTTVLNALGLSNLRMTLAAFNQWLTDVFNLLQTIVGQVISIIKGDPVTPLTADVQAVKDWFHNVTTVFNGIDFRDPLLDPSGAVDWLRNEVLQPLLDALGLGSVLDFGDFLFDVSTSVGNLVVQLAELLNKLVDGFTGSVGATLSDPAAVLTAVQGFYTNFVALGTLIDNLLDKLYDAFTGTVGAVGKSLSDVFTVAQTFYTGASAAGTQIADLIADLGGSVIGDVAAIITGLGGDITDILNTLWDIFTGNTGSTGKTLANVVSAGSSFFTGAANGAANLASLVTASGSANLAALGAALNSLIAFLTSIPASLISGVTTVEQQIADGIYQAIHGGSSTGNAVSTIKTGLLAFPGANLTGALNTATTISGNALSTLFNSSGTLASQLTGALNNTVTYGGTALSTFFSNIDSTGGLLASGVTGALNTGVTISGNAISALFNGSGALASALTGAMNTGVTISGNAISTLFSASGTLASQLTGAINTGVTIQGKAVSTLFNSSGLIASQIAGALNPAITFLVGASNVALSTLLANINSTGQFSAASITGALNGAVTFGGTTLTTLLQYLNSSGQFSAAQLTGALNTAVTYGGTALSTVLTNITASTGAINAAGITGALNTAATLGGTSLGTLSTSWNGAVTDISSLLSAASAANATALGTAVATASTNITQIGTAAQNAAAGVVGSLNTAATQVQTAFSGILNGLFGGLTGTTAPANQTQAQASAALADVTTNIVGTSAALMALQSQKASTAGLMDFKINFSDYGTASLPASFTVTADQQIGLGTSAGGITIVSGRAQYLQAGAGTSCRIAKYNVASTTTDYQEVSWTWTGNFATAGSSGIVPIYTRMNSAATSFLRFNFATGTHVIVDAVVAGVKTQIDNVFYTFKIGARYSLRVGDLTSLYKSYLYENDTLVATFNDASHVAQVGALYRSAGFGLSGANTGTAQDFGVATFRVADQLFQPGAPAAAYVSTSETTTSTTYANMTTLTDTVTVTVGSSGMLQVSISATATGNTTQGAYCMGFELSGANTLSAADSYAASIFIPVATANQFPIGNSFLVPALNPGSTTVKAKYRVFTGSGTMTAANRRISAIPL